MNIKHTLKEMGLASLYVLIVIAIARRIPGLNGILTQITGIPAA